MPLKLAALATFALVAFGLPFAEAHGGAADMPYDHMWGYGGGWGWMFIGPIMMIVIIGGVIALVVLLVRWLTGSDSGSHRASAGRDDDRALRILEERFARGEIDKEEFEERRRALTS